MWLKSKGIYIDRVERFKWIIGNWSLTILRGIVSFNSVCPLNLYCQCTRKGVVVYYIIVSIYWVQLCVYRCVCVCCCCCDFMWMCETFYSWFYVVLIYIIYFVLTFFGCRLLLLRRQYRIFLTVLLGAVSEILVVIRNYTFTSIRTRRAVLYL